MSTRVEASRMGLAYLQLAGAGRYCLELLLGHVGQLNAIQPTLSLEGQCL